MKQNLPGVSIAVVIAVAEAHVSIPSLVKP